MSDLAAPPTHPQPSFYESVKSDLGYDPDSARDLPQQHTDFLAQHGFFSWRDQTLREFAARRGKYATPVKIPRQRKPRS